MTLQETCALVAGFVLAGSKYLEVAKPLWAKLPAKLSVFLPSLVVALPTLASQLGLVKTEMDLFTVASVAVALFLPGASSAKKDS